MKAAIVRRNGNRAVLTTLALGMVLVASMAPGQTATDGTSPDRLLLKDFHPRSIYKVPQTHVEKARFPVIDVHSHPYARTPADVDRWVRIMDQVGVARTVIMVGTTGKAFDDAVALFGRHPDRFEVWCGLAFDGSDQPGFAEKAIAELVRCQKRGARGVGELSDKGRGLRSRGIGRQVFTMHIDDPRMDPILEKCGALGLPVNIHVGEDRWMYEPMDRTNDGLMNAFTWKIPDDPAVLRHDAVVATLERAVKKHPRVTFIACHYANCCSDLSILGRMFDACPNLYADMGARFAETAPIPRYMARFFERYQDRLLYGTDMGFNLEMYRTTFRILETEDEHFYSHGFSTYHWPLHGFGLREEILRKVYAGNARKILMPTRETRLNQIQVIGSHNSYHIAPAPAVMSLIAAAGKARAEGLDYTHPPLAEQFSERGIRQIELDVFHDPEGGRYAQPVARKILRGLGKDPGPDSDEGDVLRRPGMKVLHVPDVDYRSTTPTLIGALKQIRQWSKSHPDHVPIMILLELKGEPEAGLPTRPLPFGRNALQALEAEILSVFSSEEMITPEQVRGSFATLGEAIRQQGWPTLDSVRGRVLFALDNENRIRDDYLALHPSLKGQLLFVSVPESHPQAAWFKINDPIADFDRIRRLVGEGFLVRTRADADTRQARGNDPTQRDKALASGAQFVSTDYPVADKRLSPYCVQFPNRIVARANPVCGRPEAGEGDLEPGMGKVQSEECELKARGGQLSTGAEW